MAINMMCQNNRCKHYWEDNCIRNINEERIEIDEEGKCETFQEGVSDFYKIENIKNDIKSGKQDNFYIYHIYLLDNNKNVIGAYTSQHICKDSNIEEIAKDFCEYFKRTDSSIESYNYVKVSKWDVL